MGALATVVSWIPEDDLLLKNAVEAGASLESLAKGAVQFSRRYTVRELQDRWYSILYDPVISAEASQQMIEVDQSGSSVVSKFNRVGNLKENKVNASKRKSETVQNMYYALRRRICSEPFDSVDCRFVIGPNNYARNVDGPLSGDCMLGEAVPSHFELQDSDMEIIQNAFPQIMMEDAIPPIDAGASHTFHVLQQNPAQDDLTVIQNNLSNAVPNPREDNMCLKVRGSQVGEVRQSKVLPEHGLYVSDKVGSYAPTTFNQIIHDGKKISCEIEQNHIFDSPLLDSGTFHNLDCSSPLSGMPIWKTVDGILMPGIPVDLGLGEKDVCAGAELKIAEGDRSNDGCIAGCNADPGNSNLKMLISDELKKATASAEGYLAELSKSLLTFTNEEELLVMDVDGKDVIDKSYYDGLSSLLLNSPNETSQEVLPSMSEAIIPATAYGNAPKVSAASVGETSKYADANRSEEIVVKPEVKTVSSSSTSDPHFPEMAEETICCVLNTEDPEIPCNDDVVIPKNSVLPSALSKTQPKFQEANKQLSSSISEFSGIKRGIDGIGMMQKEPNGKHPGPSYKMGQKVIAESCFQHVGSCTTKSELPDADILHAASRSTVASPCAPNKLDSLQVCVERTTTASVKDEPTEFRVANQVHSLRDSASERDARYYDSFDNYVRTHASISLGELDASRTGQHNQPSHAEVMDLAVLEPDVNSLASEPMERDDDMPCFSDIEAMVLDMDLDPEDQDAHSQEEVLRYRNEETKRAIIRLEQMAHSCIQRAIAAHGALAILYGRNSKHYIRKPEVLLGRGTADFKVDVDLGREWGLNNTISRRQAVIKLEMNGSFLLKNLGKYPVWVNNKEVATGQSLNLSSNCLIEIRGMPFIFEINQQRVKHYLDNMSVNR